MYRVIAGSSDAITEKYSYDFTLPFAVLVLNDNKIELFKAFSDRGSLESFIDNRFGAQFEYLWKLSDVGPKYYLTTTELGVVTNVPETFAIDTLVDVVSAEVWNDDA